MNYAKEILDLSSGYRPVTVYEDNATKAQKNRIAKDYMLAEANMVKWIKHAHHFTLPEDLNFNSNTRPDGRIWTGGSLDKSVHLPYGMISMSSYSTSGVKVFDVVAEDPKLDENGWPAWVMFPMEHRDGKWRLPPATVRISQTDKGALCSANMISDVITQLIPEEDAENVYTSMIDSVGYDIDMLFNLLTILHDQPQTAIASTNNNVLYKTKRMNHGRRVTKKHLYKELVLSNHYAPTRSGVSIPTGVTQRAHTRRGHERHYKNGKVIWINSYRAGDASKGTIVKDYRVEP